MAQADSQSRTPRVFLDSRETPLTADAVILPRAVLAQAAEVVSGPEALDPIFATIEVHQRELAKRNQTIDAICAAEDRHKAEERDAWSRYEKASIALLTTKPTTLDGVIALMNYVGLPECSGPGACETILDGARLSSDREAATAAERFPILSAEVLQEITGERSLLISLPRQPSASPSETVGQHAAASAWRRFTRLILAPVTVDRS
jgi:hypothetical protein